MTDPCPKEYFAISRIQFNKKSIRLFWVKAQYVSTKRLAIQAYWENPNGRTEPFCMLSFNDLTLTPKLKEDEFLVKTWSENKLIYEELRKQLGNSDFPFKSVNPNPFGEIVWRVK